jgi:peptidoglycan/LPS O-acetylase OafA/YrhL
MGQREAPAPAADGRRFGAAAGSRRLIEIEALRGIAILMVLVEHLPMNLIYWRGWLFDVSQQYWRGAAGVDVFFAVSGFVIARTLVPAVATAAAEGRVRAVIGAFWVRRAFRLLPAAWLWLLMPLAGCLLFNSSGAFRPFADNLRATLAAVLNVANINLAMMLGEHRVPLTVAYWSLSLEEQFYLLLPLLLLLLRRRVAWLMALLLAYQFVLREDWLAVLTRPGALAAGELVAGWRAGPRRAAPVPVLLRRRGARVVCLGGAVAASGMLIANATHPPGGVGWGLLALLCGGMVYVASFDRGYLMAEGWGRRALALVGSRSYSLYLVHMPVFALAREIGYRMWTPGWEHPPAELAMLLGLAVPMLLVASELSYRAVEVPWRRTGTRLAARIERRV